jgi:site-specific recombinase XerD
MSALAPTLQAWFTDRLIAQRNVSPHTIRAYRDTLRLLLNYTEGRLGSQPSQLDIAQLDAPLIAAFLTHLETERGNSVTTRNIRLAAIHSLFRFAQHRHPEHAQDIARVLAIPLKRADRAIVTFLDENEIEALLDAPDRSTWTGRRDHALLVLAVQTGLRASELTGLMCGDVQLTTGPHVRCAGKGRKNRITPLTPTTRAVLEVWLAERAGNHDQPAFPTARGGRLTRDALDHRITKHIDIAAQRCPTLHEKRVTPHTLRHTAAMRLLNAGVDTTVIALWLGHERVDTTQIYLHADLALKERAIARTTPPDTRPGRYKPPDTLLAFLEAL